MSRLQRLILIVAQLLAAAALFFGHIEWRTDHDSPARLYTFSRLKQLQVQPPGHAPFTRSVRFYTGLFCRDNIERSQGLTFGIAAPLLLVGGAAYLICGWRRASRLRRNQCPECGYQLQGQTDPGCPECGWRARSRRVMPGALVCCVSLLLDEQRAVP